MGNQLNPNFPGTTVNKDAGPLVHPDGRTVTLLDRGTDHLGDYLVVEHRVFKQGAMNGPHWHPVLTETFTVKEGAMRFMVDGREKRIGSGERLTVDPNQVHQFWNVSDKQLIVIHEIRPPGHHWEMFTLIHRLECEGKISKKGIPLHPMWLGRAWEYMDGYIAGPPEVVQRVCFGGLARLAKWLGYKI